MYLKNTPSANLHPERPSPSPVRRSHADMPGMVAASETGGALQAKRVAILLCTYNGSRFLEEQLASICAQDHANWTIEVSDDGSTDDTKAIIGALQASASMRISAVKAGPARGFVANFLSSAQNASDSADYYAFSDQDDLWEKDKLSRAVAWLDTIDPAIPALYCSRTRLVDASNREIGLSQLFSKPPSFANALVQSIAGGNTLVFNQAARRLLADAGVADGVVSHDWWFYLLVTGCGGRVHYDPHPTVRYRQHDSNLVGANGHWRARRERVRQLFGGHFRFWCDQHVVALAKFSSRLTPENQKILEQFSIARQQRLFHRLAGFARCGIHRQTFLGNLGLIAAAIFKKI